MLPGGCAGSRGVGQMMHSQAHSSQLPEPSSFKAQGFNLVCLILNATHIYLINIVFRVLTF